MLQLNILNLAVIANEIQGPQGCVFDCEGTCDTGCIVGHGHWAP